MQCLTGGLDLLKHAGWLGVVDSATQGRSAVPAEGKLLGLRCWFANLRSERAGITEIGGGWKPGEGGREEEEGCEPGVTWSRSSNARIGGRVWRFGGAICES